MATRPVVPPLGYGLRADKQEEVRRRTEAEIAVDEKFADLEDPLRQIPDDTPVDTASLTGEADVFDVLRRMDRDLIALREVKDRIEEIAALLLVDRLRRGIGLEAEPPTLHMSFTGNPGTGKTTVAKRMGEILYKLGYVRKGHLVVATREDLVGQYIGHTAPKTQEVLKRAMGGVLFIDEAYNLYRPDNERDYGQETNEMLLQAMEDSRGDIVVVMAGYKDRMEKLFKGIPGMFSRIGHHIDFPDYSLQELVDIGRLMLEQQRYRLSEDGDKAFQEYLERRMNLPHFANARSVRNAIDRARMRQAIRLYQTAQQTKRLTKKDLVTIEAEDILKSRLFQSAQLPPD